MSVLVRSESRALLSWLVRLSYLRFQGPWSKPPKIMLVVLFQLEMINFWWFRAEWKAPRKQIVFFARERDIWNIRYCIMVSFSVPLILMVMSLSTAALFGVILVPGKMFNFFAFFSYSSATFLVKPSIAWWYENLAYFEAEHWGSLHVSHQQRRSPTFGDRSSIILAAHEKFLEGLHSISSELSSRFRFDSGTWGWLTILRPLGILLFFRHGMMKL